MLTEERKQELARKVKFVDEIGKVIKDNIYNVDSIRYEVYEQVSSGWVQERLVVTFKGGAISVRNCNGTSCSGILQSIAKLVDGGYYDEVSRYRALRACSDFVLIRFEK